MFLLALLACQPDGIDTRTPLAYSGESRPGGLVWGGFRQDWGYNHRVNSLGDWVGEADCDAFGCDAELGHSAASGSGSDVATWSGSGTLLAAPDTSFVQGAATFELSAQRSEGALLEVATVVTVPLDEATAARARFAAVLGGFDLYAVEDADKLATFSIALGDVERVDATAVQFEVRATLDVDCDSLECDGLARFDRSVDYRLRVPWLLVAGDGLTVTEQRLTTEYRWDGPAGEVLDADAPTARAAVDLPRADLPAVPALRGFRVALDDDHHMAGWSSEVAVEAQEQELATARFEGRFQQWNEGVREEPLAYGEAGAASFSADVVLLQAEGACVHTQTWGGSAWWEADGGAAGSDAPVHVSPEVVEAPEECAGTVLDGGAA